jgi:hypothetical protein
LAVEISKRFLISQGTSFVFIKSNSSEMSKADKMRGKLLNVQKEREEFERQKRDLEQQV